jgi:hypothetical protein
MTVSDMEGVRGYEERSSNVHPNNLEAWHLSSLTSQDTLPHVVRLLLGMSQIDQQDICIAGPW